MLELHRGDLTTGVQESQKKQVNEFSNGCPIILIKDPKYLPFHDTIQLKVILLVT